MNNMRRIFLLGLLIFAFALLFNVNTYIALADEESAAELTEEEEAQVETKTIELVEKGLKWETGIDVSYNSNVFLYSHDDIDEYDAGTNVNRFKGVDSIDDIITNLFLIIRAEKEIFNFSPTIFSLGVEGNIYAENEDRTYAVIQTSLRQKIGADNLIRVGYKFIPNYFVRTLYDPDMPAADRFRKAKFDSHSIHLKYWHRMTNDLTSWLRYTYENKDYNAYFDERDTGSHRITLASGYTPRSWIKFNPFFRYFWHNADGEDLDADVDADISRDGYDLGLNTWFYPEGKFSHLIGYAFRSVNYSTSNSITDDPYHAGRDQKRHRIKGRVNYEWKDNIDLFAEYVYEIRNVDVAGSDADLIQESILGYIKHVGRVGLKTSF